MRLISLIHLVDTPTASHSRLLVAIPLAASLGSRQASSINSSNPKINNSINILRIIRSNPNRNISNSNSNTTNTISMRRCEHKRSYCSITLIMKM